MKYEVVIGIEVHAQLSTNSKMFCSCSTTYGALPNKNICPVCTGQPGTLPVLNSKAVEYAVRTALAFNCGINVQSIFARKNYFYPDLPKGYQISQYDQPLAVKGNISISLSEGGQKNIGVTRVHLEEDAGKNIHDDHGSYVDFNRSGVPLVEIVSEPDMRSPQEAVLYFKKLRSILCCIETSSCNMEEGNLRCDANISLMPKGSNKFGTKVEIKNLNSFRFLEKALAYEVQRQAELLDAGKKIDQETRLFDSVKGITKSMRKKEEANDYRYFPEPDLSPLIVEEAYINSIKSSMPELPDAKRSRLVSQYSLSDYDAEVISSDKALTEYYEALVSSGLEPKMSSNWLQTEVMRVLNERKTGILDFPISALSLSSLIKMVKEGKINQNTAKEVFNEMLDSSKSAEQIVSEKGLDQIQDEGAIEKIVDEVIASSTEQVQQYKDGKTNLMGHFVGMVMKKSKGKANPQVVNSILKKKIG